MNHKYLKTLIKVFSWMTFAGFVFLSYYLSSQNGKDTYNTSIGIARVLAKIFYGQPDAGQIVRVHTAVRHMAHFFIYFIMAVLAYLVVSLSGLPKQYGKVHIIFSGVIFLFILVYAYWDEWHKQYIPGRHTSVGEFGLNVAGCVCGLLICNWIQWRRGISEKKNLCKDGQGVKKSD